MAYATDDALVNQVAKAMCAAYWRGYYKHRQGSIEAQVKIMVDASWKTWITSSRAQLNMVDQPAQRATGAKEASEQ